MPMKNIFKTILFHEALSLLWAAAMTAVIVVIYREYDQMEKIFTIWFVISQVFVVIRAIQARKQ